MSARAILVAAAASGQGKTTVTAALARRLRRDGARVRAFKTGPDFLDPLTLARASGAEVDTLDLWMVGEAGCRQRLAAAAQDADWILVEAVMGLYDGAPSSADLANRFGLPVLAVLDARAMAQTAGALALGLRDYGPVQLAGVLANRVAGDSHAAMVAESLRDIPLLGHLPRQAQSLPERHLGLGLPDELADFDARLDALADSLVLDDAAWQALPRLTLPPEPAPALPPLLAGRRLALARDAAFAFVYPANLACLRALGAELVEFSPLADQPLPAGVDALYLPGGYPELHAETLSRARAWQASVRAAHAAGLPIWAECGGMMALADAIETMDGHSWGMAGLLPGVAHMQDRLAGLGGQAWGALRGHTFHYSRLELPPEPQAHTVSQRGGGRGEAIYRVGSLQASYFHAYFPSAPEQAAALFLPAEDRPC
ncbi:cobyrinate a,c-diamide synthase [Rivihabitans pingtungensis]|uniref:Cobyrinic acid a,c-diamide synthase n=1 Tax=Rivihabitans pingtungensis TaxID=1054498 RepID=A0A318KY56_9NEIS|nr:cobyrinate a,c-diamide synthase [Rivihabitans pingtungensis]PXX81828.1 cobyrinic acid a,c-diamide synthase [Rivihabitans pingtungensis]